VIKKSSILAERAKARIKIIEPNQKVNIVAEGSREKMRIEDKEE
jgi:hypothetical protein